ncbi:plectin [Acrasis kona]|uniref:Plectin n=1 Tax=Acrasis kona TaxID=1008807 RepID=A0AAW2ZI55_9EUKA
MDLTDVVEKSKLLILDLLSQIEVLKSQNDQVENTCDHIKETQSEVVAPSSYNIISNIIEKHDLENKKNQAHYEERMKEVCDERDTYMKDFMDLSMKFQSNNDVNEHLRAKVIQLEQDLQASQKVNASQVQKMEQTDHAMKESFEQCSRLITEVDQIKKVVCSYEQNYDKVQAFITSLTDSNTLLQKCIDRKTLEANKIIKEKSDLLKRSIVAEDQLFLVKKQVEEAKRTQSNIEEKLIQNNTLIESLTHIKQDSNLISTDFKLILSNAIRDCDLRDAEIVQLKKERVSDAIHQQSIQNNAINRQDELDATKLVNELNETKMKLQETDALIRINAEKFNAACKQYQSMAQQQELQISEYEDNLRKSQQEIDYLQNRLNESLKDDTTAQLEQNLNQFNQRIAQLEKEPLNKSNQNQKLQQELNVMNRKNNRMDENKNPSTPNKTNKKSTNNSTSQRNQKSTNNMPTLKLEPKECPHCDIFPYALMIPCKKCGIQAHAACATGDSRTYVCPACNGDFTNGEDAKCSTPQRKKTKLSIKKVSFDAD